MMFPLPFKKKAEEPKRVYIPVDLVLNYAAQGFSEQEIISRLQTQGFEPEHIDRALKIALKERVSATPGFEVSQPEPALPRPTDFYGASPEPIVSRRPAPMGYPPERMVSPEEPRPVSLEDARQPFTFEPKNIKESESSVEEITVEELIEGIVSERWQEFEERLADFEKRDMQLQSQIEDLRKRFKEIDESLSSRETGLTGKMDEFGDSMSNIEGRIGSIERVFREVLPELSGNIKTMTDFVEKVKEEEKK
jgi:DNA-binding transcriptional MerR regulator